MPYNQIVVGVFASFFVFGRQQDLTRQVSLDIPVQSANQALKAISQQTGVPMNAIGKVGTEIVFLKVQNRPLKEVMDKLGGVTKGTWRTESNGSYTLIRPQAIIDQENEKQIVENVRLLSKWQENEKENLRAKFDAEHIRAVGYRYLKKLNSHKWNNSREDDQKFDPVQRGYSRCLVNVNFEEIVKLRNSEQVVYSTRPTKVQRRLPVEIISNLVSEQSLWAGVMSAISWKDDSGKEIAGITKEDDSAVYSSFQTFKPFVTEPYLVTLTISKNEYGSYRVQFAAFNENGQQIIELNDDFHPLQFKDDQDEKPKGFKAIQLPQPQSATLALWGCDLEGNPVLTAEKHRPEYLKFGLNAVRQDGLLAGNQELMTAISVQRGKSVVACIPDDAGILAARFFAFDRFFQDIQTPWKCNESNDWIELYPQDYVAHWHTRVTRTRFANLIADVASNDNIDLRNYARFYCGDPGYLVEGDIFELADTCVEVLKPEGAPQLVYNPGFIHLFASLTDDQMNRLSRGQIIPYRQLSSSQRDMARMIVYGRPGNCFVGGEAKTPFERYDATFELPNGIDGGPGIGFEVSDDDVCIATSAEDSRSSFTINVATRKDQYMSFQGGCGNYSRPSTSMLFEFFKQKRITLRCYLSTDHWLASDFCQGKRKLDGKQRTYRELSPRLKELIDQSPSFVESDLWVLRARLQKLMDGGKLNEKDARNIKESINWIDEQLASRQPPR